MKLSLIYLSLLILLSIFKYSESLSIKHNDNIYINSGEEEDISKKPPACGDLSVCLFTEINYKGKSYEYSIYDGASELPFFIQNNITSFVANADVCFIANDENNNLKQQIYSGEYLSNYYIVFGDITETIKPGLC